MASVKWTKASLLAKSWLMRNLLPAKALVLIALGTEVHRHYPKANAVPSAMVAMTNATVKMTRRMTIMITGQAAAIPNCMRATFQNQRYHLSMPGDRTQSFQPPEQDCSYIHGL